MMHAFATRHLLPQEDVCSGWIVGRARKCSRVILSSSSRLLRIECSTLCLARRMSYNIPWRHQPGPGPRRHASLAESRAEESLSRDACRTRPSNPPSQSAPSRLGCRHVPCFVRIVDRRWLVHIAHARSTLLEFHLRGKKTRRRVPGRGGESWPDRP